MNGLRKKINFTHIFTEQIRKYSCDIFISHVEKIYCVFCVINNNETYSFLAIFEIVVANVTTIIRQDALKGMPKRDSVKNVVQFLPFTNFYDSIAWNKINT